MSPIICYLIPCLYSHFTFSIFVLLNSKPNRYYFLFCFVFYKVALWSLTSRSNSSISTYMQYVFTRSLFRSRVRRQMAFSHFDYFRFSRFFMASHDSSSPGDVGFALRTYSHMVSLVNCMTSSSCLEHRFKMCCHSILGYS